MFEKFSAKLLSLSAIQPWQATRFVIEHFPLHLESVSVQQYFRQFVELFELFTKKFSERGLFGGRYTCQKAGNTGRLFSQPVSQWPQQRVSHLLQRYTYIHIYNVSKNRQTNATKKQIFKKLRSWETTSPLAPAPPFTIFLIYTKVVC